MKRLIAVLTLVTVAACAHQDAFTKPVSDTGLWIQLCAKRQFTLAEMRQAFEEGVGFGLSEPVRETDEAFKRLVLRGKCQ
jgi:hypothetical protein